MTKLICDLCGKQVEEFVGYGPCYAVVKNFLPGGSKDLCAACVEELHDVVRRYSNEADNAIDAEFRVKFARNEESR